MTLGLACRRLLLGSQVCLGIAPVPSRCRRDDPARPPPPIESHASWRRPSLPARCQGRRRQSRRRQGSRRRSRRPQNRRHQRCRRFCQWHGLRSWRLQERPCSGIVIARLALRRLQSRLLGRGMLLFRYVAGSLLAHCCKYTPGMSFSFLGSVRPATFSPLPPLFSVHLSLSTSSAARQPRRRRASLFAVVTRCTAMSLARLQSALAALKRHLSTSCFHSCSSNNEEVFVTI